ncbi:MAG: hypothetical protein QW308_00230 [Candidatus Woesearchaeota archaeon]
MIAIFIAAVMILSTAGFIIGQSSSGSFEYNGYRFVQTAQGYKVKVDGKLLYFNYLPTALESVSLPADAIAALKNSRVISISYEPNSSLVEGMAQAQFYLEKALSELGIFVQKGLTNSTGYLLQLDCRNATALSPLVLISEGSEGADFSENCLKLSAQNEQEIIMQAERLVYGLTGIMR